MNNEILHKLNEFKGVNLILSESIKGNLLRSVNRDFEELYKYSSIDCLESECMEKFDNNDLILRIKKDGSIRIDTALFSNSYGSFVPVSIKSFPLKKDNGAVVGVMQIMNDNSVEQEALKIVKNLQDKMRHDHLTEIGNRIGIKETIEKKIEEYRRHKTCFAVIFIDIDNFKTINDTYGHETLKSSIRNIDYVGRWGGEEFIVVAPYAEPLNSSIIAERIRVNIEKLIVSYDNIEIMTTASIGVTNVVATDTVDSLIARSDKLMYMSKEDGKNKVTEQI